MKSTFFFLFTIWVGFQSFSQNLKCKDFEQGTFTITADYIPGVEWIIKRTKKEQIESVSKTPEQYKEYLTKTVYSKIEWINKCTYKLSYIPKEEPLDEIETSTNKNGGVITKLTQQKDKCFLFTSKSILDNGIPIISKGTICKIK